jgi:signal transduction protein with GAF and PtsI domain
MTRRTQAAGEGRPAEQLRLFGVGAFFLLRPPVNQQEHRAMTSTTDRYEPHEGDDMEPTNVNDRTTITVPLVLTIGGVLLGAVLWANSMNVTLAVVQKDQTNDRDRLQRIELALERVELKLDRMRERQP